MRYGFFVVLECLRLIAVDLVIDVPTVSNRHCLIFTEAKGGSNIALLEDTSGNGTFVNDQRIKEHKLQHGDRVRIGNELFVYHKD